jgi:predicted adenylyl cyclase CyaB
MATELELKITDIDKDEAIARLKELKADYVDTFHYKRIIGIPKHTKKGYESWFRVRTDNKLDNVITFKQRKLGTEMVPMEKFQVVVDNIDEAVEIVKRATKKMLYFENKRIQYMLGNLKITVDKWPYLPWSLEIEGDTEKQILDGFKKMNIKGRILGNASGGEGYKLYGVDYEKVGGEKSHKIKEMKKTDFLHDWVDSLAEGEIVSNINALNSAIKSNNVR